MRLSIKVLVPSLVLLALLTLAAVLLLADAHRQWRVMNVQRAKLLESVRFARTLSDIYEDIAVEVLAYRADGKQRRVEVIQANDAGASAAIRAYRPPDLDPAERALLSAMNEARTRSVGAREQFVWAIAAGEPVATRAAFERWYVHRTRFMATLDDLAAFSFNRFTAAMAAQQEQRSRLAGFVALGIVVSMGVVAGGVVHMRKVLGAPLERLAEQIKELGGGHLASRADAALAARRDEIGALASAFNGMADQLEAFTRGLEDTVAGRTAELEVANRELEAFASSASHDLRAPLRAIDGFSEILQEDCSEQLGDAGRGHLERIRAAARKMEALIDGLLNLSRVTRAQLSRDRIDLSAVANNLVGELRAADPGRNAEVEVAPGLVAQGDLVLLTSMLQNLLSNAWKFTSRQANAHIEVGVTEKDGESVFFVRDDGAGFEAGEAKKLFTPFSRLHSAEEFPGTGVGLATVKRVVQRHGGRIWAESVIGKGATFFFQLPAART